MRVEQSDRVRKTESRLPTAFAVNPAPFTAPRLLPSQIDQSVQPCVAFSPGTCSHVKLRSAASAPLFIRRIAMLECRASLPLRGLYSDIVTGKPQSARAHHEHGLNCSVVFDCAKSEPEKPA